MIGRYNRLPPEEQRIVIVMLLGYDHCHLDRRDDPPCDEQLTEQLAGKALLEQDGLQLVLVDQPALDEDLTQVPPGVLGHGTPIGVRPALQ